MGNSITEGWIGKHPEFFSSHGYVSRAISGQTTSQMLVRFPRRCRRAPAAGRGDLRRHERHRPEYGLHLARTHSGQPPVDGRSGPRPRHPADSLLGAAHRRLPVEPRAGARAEDHPSERDDQGLCRRGGHSLCRLPHADGCRGRFDDRRLHQRRRPSDRKRVTWSWSASCRPSWSRCSPRSAGRHAFGHAKKRCGPSAGPHLFLRIAGLPTDAGDAAGPAPP